MWDWLTWHNLAIAAVTIVGIQGLRWLGSWLDGSAVSTWIAAEFKKLREYEESTKLGAFLKQFHADDALWKLAENSVHVVFHELSADVQDLITQGDLTKVDWKKYGDAMWAKIRDQAQGGVHDYLEHSSSEDGAQLCAFVAQTVFAKLHLNIQLNNANPAPLSAPASVTVNTSGVVVAPPAN